MLLEDNKIIELFFARSDRAIKAISEKYGKLCFKVAFNILNNHEDSEECVNDAYLGAWNTIPPQKPNPLQAYILKLTRNHALNRYDYNSAKKRASGLTTCLEELEFCLSSNDDPEKAFEEKQITEYIDEFIETLSEANRLLFVRRFWYADTYEQLSVLTGIKVSTLKVRIMRMRDSLRDYLSEKGVAA